MPLTATIAFVTGAGIISFGVGYFLGYYEGLVTAERRAKVKAARTEVAAARVEAARLEAIAACRRRGGA